MEASERDELIAEWHRNERELVALQDLPVGAEDPATREAALEKRQDAIEFALGSVPKPDPIDSESGQE
jgi:hypothetical protein